MTPDENKKRIEEIDALMLSADFWADKDRAQAAIKERAELIVRAEGGDTHDRGAATVSDLLNADFLHKIIPNLSALLKLVSSTQIRNIATLAGNFVNASPSQCR